MCKTNSNPKLKVIVTGAYGFIGRNLINALEEMDICKVVPIGRKDSCINEHLSDADAVFHLAGVNRTENLQDFFEVNASLTETIVDSLLKLGRKIPLVYSSSTQATHDNDYGVSKRQGEAHVLRYCAAGGKGHVLRLPNVYGKWSRPNYNTVVATFCHNIARGMPVRVDEPDAALSLIYIDDVVDLFCSFLPEQSSVEDVDSFLEARTDRLTVGGLRDMIESFAKLRQGGLLPSFADRLGRNLYTTYLSFLPEDGFGYDVELREDDRGWLFEFIKTTGGGQIFVSSTHPGITRGNHYHKSKVEKFCVIQGKGCIRFRHVNSGELIEYHVDGAKPSVVDIPPGYTHSIENTGSEEMLTLFWANEVFDPAAPDTYFRKVLE